VTQARKRPPTVAANLLARPGSAPARTTAVEDLPRVAPSPQPESGPTAPAWAREDAAGGIKKVTIGTTLYLLPGEHKRIRRLALDLDVPSVHELILLGLDRLLAERGQPPIQRYSPPRPKKG
jgi:hypothetical protein